ncbi:SH3 domain-containing protein [Roseibium sp. AS2]|uniref:SH3 domain-containing protein n=1 Tax=Roseibium sp. AS2 TaxID=3135781 RepID=UPI00317A3C2D
MLIRLSLALIAVALTALPAAAQSRPAIAYTTANLNMRAGPGTNYPVIATVPRGGGVTVFGCTADFRWCDAAFVNMKGWVSGKYLSYGGDGIYYGRPLPSAGIHLGVPRYRGNYRIYPSGGPVYKGGPPVAVQPVPAQPRVLPPAQGYPYGQPLPRNEPCPRYPDRYFEHQVC